MAVDYVGRLQARFHAKGHTFQSRVSQLEDVVPMLLSYKVLHTVFQQGYASHAASLCQRVLTNTSLSLTNTDRKALIALQPFIGANDQFLLMSVVLMSNSNIFIYM